MDATVEVSPRVDADAARALSDPARRAAAGRYLSDLLKGERVHEVLAEAIAEARHEARSRGPTDQEMDAELDAWRAESRG
jgi:hypothetical protein